MASYTVTKADGSTVVREEGKEDVPVSSAAKAASSGSSGSTWTGASGKTYGDGSPTPYEQIASGTGEIGARHAAVTSRTSYSSMEEVKQVSDSAAASYRANVQAGNIAPVATQANVASGQYDAASYNTAMQAAAAMNRQYEGMEVVRVQPAADGGFSVKFNTGVSQSPAMYSELRKQLMLFSGGKSEVVDTGSGFSVKAVKSASSSVISPSAPQTAAPEPKSSFDFTTNTLTSYDSGTQKMESTVLKPAVPMDTGSTPASFDFTTNTMEYSDGGRSVLKPAVSRPETPREAVLYAQSAAIGAKAAAPASNIEISTTKRPAGLLDAQFIATEAFINPAVEYAKGYVAPGVSSTARSASESAVRGFANIGTEYQRGSNAFVGWAQETGAVESDWVGRAKGELVYGAAQLSYAGYDAYARVSIVAAGGRAVQGAQAAYASGGMGALKEFATHDIVGGAVEIAGTPARFATGIIPVGKGASDVATKIYGTGAIAAIGASLAGDKGVVGSFGQGQIDVIQKVGRYATFQSKPGEADELIVGSAVWNMPYYGAKMVQARLTPGSIPSGLVEAAYKGANVGAGAYIVGEQVVKTAKEKGNLSPATVAQGLGRASGELSFVENLFEAKTIDPVFEGSGFYKGAQAAVERGIAKGAVDIGKQQGLWSGVEIDNRPVNVGSSADVTLRTPTSKGMVEIKLTEDVKPDLQPKADVKPDTEYRMTFDIRTPGSRFDIRPNEKVDVEGMREPQKIDWPSSRMDMKPTTRMDYPTDIYGLRPTEKITEKASDVKYDIPEDVKNDVRMDVRPDVRMDIVNPGVLAPLLLPLLSGSGGGGGMTASSKKSGVTGQIPSLLEVELAPKGKPAIKRASRKKTLW